MARPAPQRAASFSLTIPPPPRPTLFPYTTLFRSDVLQPERHHPARADPVRQGVRTGAARSEEHTSELQSQFHLVCRLLLEKKNLRQERHEVRIPATRHLPVRLPAPFHRLHTGVAD